MGFSFGGWLAAEIAAASCHRLARLILVDPLGIKLGDRESRDILDLFNTAPAEVQRRTWHDPSKWSPDFNTMSDDAIVVHARNRDALCLYGWQPFMYNPKLPRWLCRIAVPTLVLWGASDGVVTPDYGRAYCDLIPGARFEMIEGAGHHPEMEQPGGVRRAGRYNHRLTSTHARREYDPPCHSRSRGEAISNRVALHAACIVLFLSLTLLLPGLARAAELKLSDLEPGMADRSSGR